MTREIKNILVTVRAGFIGDIEKAKKLLNYNPSVSIEEGI